LDAVMQSSQWNSTALFLVWDDWGGLYDHVAPPVVERWSDGTPLRYGFRVPCIVVSPYARRGYVSHELHSLVSITQFIETTCGLASLNFRDANASTLLDCFDFASPPRPGLTLTPRACG
jgi:phospholipase C